MKSTCFRVNLDCLLWCQQKYNESNFPLTHSIDVTAQKQHCLIWKRRGTMEHRSRESCVGHVERCVQDRIVWPVCIHVLPRALARQGLQPNRSWLRESKRVGPLHSRTTCVLFGVLTGGFSSLWDGAGQLQRTAKRAIWRESCCK